MLKIGLTGGIGSGKSVVSSRFAQLGVPIIDTDIIARKLVKPGTETLTLITAHFGKQVLHKDGRLNRQTLARIIFQHPAQRKILETLLHPRINTEIKRQLTQINATPVHPEAGQQANYVMIVIPLLFENHFEFMVDKILLIYADENQRINRVRQRDQRDIKEIKQIISTQINPVLAFDRADDILMNDNDLAHLYLLIDALHRKYSLEAV